VAWTRGIGPALFVAGVVLLGLAVARGEASLFLVLVFPIVEASGALGAVGILLLVAGFLASFFTFPIRDRREAPSQAEPPRPDVDVRGVGSSRRWGGVVFLGPVPIVLGSDARMTRAMLFLGVALFIALLAFTIILLLRGV
jgi:uncharacterized protein (TIGR00304 family)